MKNFPVPGVDERRSITASNLPGLPDGEYGFLELYCDEPGCDCRRVIIDVLRPETGWNKIMATINYGWESMDFYRKWGGSSMRPDDVQGPILDPINPQTECSTALLEIFRQMIQSPEYVARLKRHYEMFRAAVEKDSGRKSGMLANFLENRRKRLRDPRRRGRHR
jgi:hypothetical protein